MGCSESHSQSHPVAWTGACSVFLLVALTAGPGAWGGVGAGWLWVRLVAWFWGQGKGWRTEFPLACTHCGVVVPDLRMLGPSRLVSSNIFF